jgi:hypothetical protein
LVCWKDDFNRFFQGEATLVSDRTREIWIIVALLVVTGIIGFGLIPLGISEGSGNIGPGLSPRPMPELATGGIALALIFGLIQYLTKSVPDADAQMATHQEGGHPLRAVVAITICLLFATIGFRVSGFYLGGVAMAALLTLLLGDRKILNIIVIPVLVLIFIYLVFEFGFQIRLPKSGLIPGIPL